MAFTTVTFESPSDRREFICHTKVVGIFNNATICFMESTGEFWSVLRDTRIKVSISEISYMGFNPSKFKRVIHD